MYLDSDVFLGCLYPKDVWHEWALGIQQQAEPVYTSAVTLLELAFVVQRDKKESTLGLRARVLREFPNVEFIDLKDSHVARAFELQAEYGLLPMDAIHLAVCLEHDSRMASTDRAFTRIPGLAIVAFT